MFFPPLTSQLRAKISHFRQGESETLFDAWDRFKELSRRCPQHGFELSSQVQIFYNGVTYASRTSTDTTSRGTITRKTTQETHELLEELAKNNYQAPLEISVGRKKPDYKKLIVYLLNICVGDNWNFIGNSIYLLISY